MFEVSGPWNSTVLSLHRVGCKEVMGKAGAMIGATLPVERGGGETKGGGRQRRLR